MPEIRANVVDEDFLERFALARARRGRMKINEATVEAVTLWCEMVESGRASIEPPTPAPIKFALAASENQDAAKILSALGDSLAKKPESFAGFLADELGVPIETLLALKPTARKRKAR